MREERISDYSDYRAALELNRDRNDGSLSPFTFICVTLILTLMGGITLYSSSYPEAIMNGLPHWYYIARQGIFACLGLVVACIIAIIPEKWIKLSSFPLLAISLASLLLTLFSPYGVTVLGARRWLDLPLLPQFQPSEIVKISMIIFLSYFFSEPKFRKYLGWYYVIPVLLTLLFALLILMQKAYTTTILFLITCLVLFLAGGYRLRYIITFCAFLAVPALCVLFSESYRVKRIASFIFPDLDPSGLNWQINMSLSAIGEGGFFGKGLGNGYYKLGSLPEVQNDFIFASFAEECGLIGVAILFILFALFALLGIRASRRERMINPFYSNLALGITSMIVFQVLINIAVVTGLLPPTGIPLPFFSQGGTNLFVVIAECGLRYRVISHSVRSRNG
ncbi:MAG: FtsW/RodA/SpoVE family cell cycle protein [Bullifex sp.]